MANFKDILDKSTDSIERPKALPAGTYHGVIKQREFGESAKKQTPFVRYTVQVTSAGDDVEPSLLEGINLSAKTLRREYYLTDDALYRLKELIQSLGHSTEGRSVGAIIDDAINGSVIITVKQRPSEDGSEVYNDISDMKGV